MNAWEEERLSPGRITKYVDNSELIDDLIEFYSDNGNPDLVKVVRGWAKQRGIPYTQ
jgi:hypothetical protein